MLKPALRIPLLLALVSALLTPGVVGAQGILLLAHGGRDDWNRQVLELASQVDSTLPVEVAFGMANKRMIQDAVDRLAERDISGIVAVPLFISSHSSVMRATEYLLGSRDEAPPELQAFARMGARRDAGRAGSDPGFDRTTPVETTVPISMTTALDGHALVAEILISRAVDVSRTPEDEIVVLVAHGPSSAEDNDLWLDDMSILAKGMRPRTRFSRIEYLRTLTEITLLCAERPKPQKTGSAWMHLATLYRSRSLRFATMRRIRLGRRRPRNCAPWSRARFGRGSPR